MSVEYGSCGEEGRAVQSGECLSAHRIERERVLVLTRREDHQSPTIALQDDKRLSFSLLSTYVTAFQAKAAMSPDVKGGHRR